MNYNDDFTFPDEPEEIDGLDGMVFHTIHPDHATLLYRREEFGMTQRAVADAAGITLRQYQKFESGERNMSSASLRIGMAICHVLKLDPYRFVDLPISD